MIACHHAWGGGYGKIFFVLASPTHFTVFVHLFVCFVCLVHRSHLIFFGFLSEGIVLCIVVDLVYPWEGVILGASYVTILEQNSPSFSHIVY